MSTRPDPAVTLRPLDVTVARAVVAGDRRGRTWAPDFPADGDRVVAGLLAEQHPPVGDQGAPPAPWGQPWLVLERRSVVGTVGCIGPVDAGCVEIGYGVVPSVRGRGVATAAVRQLLRLLADSAVSRVVAQTAPGNAGSQGVLRHLGFQPSGVRQGDDGPLLQWVLELPR